MKKKILVIELLNIIYENQNVPDKVQYKDTIYLYDELYQDYRLFNKKTNEFRNMFEFIKDNCSYWLYEVVEILEDEEEIDINDIEELVGNVNVRMNNKMVDAEDLFYTISNIVLSLENSKEKTNQLIKAVKQLAKNKVDYI